jgi:hypothetical protein
VPRKNNPPAGAIYWAKIACVYYGADSEDMVGGPGFDRRELGRGVASLVGCGAVGALPAGHSAPGAPLRAP